MSKNILVIDDEGLVTKSLQRLLQSKGYNVVVAGNGLIALEKVKDTDFDLIISDVRMPQMDGIETIRNIRKFLKQQGKKSIPEIVITGYADADKYENAMSLKVREYLFKPFDNADFLEVVQKVLG